MTDRTAASSHHEGARHTAPLTIPWSAGDSCTCQAWRHGRPANPLKVGQSMDITTDDGQRPSGCGYRPMVLTLSGFKGIRSGLGRNTLRLDLEALAGEATLVAIAGANGRGKTTVMDNLHPLC